MAGTSALGSVLMVARLIVMRLRVVCARVGIWGERGKVRDSSISMVGAGCTPLRRARVEFASIVTEEGRMGVVGCLGEVERVVRCTLRGRLRQSSVDRQRGRRWRSILADGLIGVVR